MSTFRPAMAPPTLKVPDIELSMPRKGLTGPQMFGFVGLCMGVGLYRYISNNRQRNDEIIQLQKERTFRLHMLTRLYPSMFLGLAPYQNASDSVVAETRTDKFLDAVEQDLQVKQFDMVMGMRADPCDEVKPYKITSTDEETKAHGSFGIPLSTIIDKMNALRK